jgi:hypothetical protein
MSSPPDHIQARTVLEGTPGQIANITEFDSHQPIAMGKCTDSDVVAFRGQ